MRKDSAKIPFRESNNCRNHRQWQVPHVRPLLANVGLVLRPLNSRGDPQVSAELPKELFATISTVSEIAPTVSKEFLGGAEPGAPGVIEKVLIPEMINSAQTSTSRQITRETALLRGVKRRNMNTSTKDKIKGSFHEAKGTVKEAVGKITNDRKLKAEGKAEKNVGKVQQQIGNAKEAVATLKGKLVGLKNK